MITSEKPETWQALQVETAAILRECGLTVEIEKKLRTARGEVEVDVYAEELVKGRKNTIICECKHWSNRVPQFVIHAFRTTIGDIGANTGYIISTRGFQSGAFTASELTNIELKTWEEFQAAFEETWLEEHFTKQLNKRLDALLSYTEPLLPAWFHALPDSEQGAFLGLKDKYDSLGYLVMLMAPYVRIFHTAPSPALPLIESLRDKPEFLRMLPSDVAEAVAYKQFFAHLIQHGETAIAEFRAVRDRNNVQTRPDPS